MEVGNFSSKVVVPLPVCVCNDIVQCASVELTIPPISLRIPIIMFDASFGCRQMSFQLFSLANPLPFSHVYS